MLEATAAGAPSPPLRGEGGVEGQPGAESSRGQVLGPGRDGGRAPAPVPAPAHHSGALPAEANADGPIWHGAAFYPDGWATAADGEPVPDTPVILSKPRWLAERNRLASRNSPLGLRLEPGDSIEDIAADLPRFTLIALSFPKFADGRAFSTATLLRDKHGFAGELRAVGSVLSDQIPYMRRCGFDTFEVTHAPTRRALAEGRIPEVTLYYQPAAAPEASAGPRPWLRRAAPK